MNIKKFKEISLKGTPRVNPAIVLREEFENHAFLYDPDTGDTFVLNPVGAFVWKCLDGRRSIDQIMDKVNWEFDEVSSSVFEDLKAFLNDLRAKGFIE